ncbi:MAG: hypothetical protein AAF413_03785 [Patescibacteria group bacterium]
MIQLNLLPDVKIEFIKTRRLRRLITLVSILVTGVALLVFVLLLLTTTVWKGRTIDGLEKDLNSGIAELQSPDLNKIVTIQNQLGAINGLHESKSAPSRVYSFLNQLIPPSQPVDLTVGEVSIDFEEATISMRGQASSLERVNELVDTLKFTKFKTSITPEETVAFNSIVLRQANLSEVGATYSIGLIYEPELFLTAAENVELIIPNIVTTRSELERPSPIFEALPEGVE